MPESDITKVTRTTESGRYPDVILIDNFSGCNLECSMCDHKNIKKYRKIQKMDIGLYMKIIDEVSLEHKEATVWQIYFGEPFLLKDIAERIQYAKYKGIKKVALNSNGVLMTPDKAINVIRAGLDYIDVGIDAFTKETYDKIRIGGDFEKAKANVHSYKRLLKVFGKTHQKLYVQFVVTDINENEVDDFKEYWLSNGVGVKIRPKVSWAGLVDASNLTEENQQKRKPCYWLMRAINICADGRVSLCSVDLHCRVDCGNIKENSIKEIWKGKLAEYRNMHKNGQWDKLPDMCHNCMDWQSTYSEIYECE